MCYGQSVTLFLLFPQACLSSHQLLLLLWMCCFIYKIVKNILSGVSLIFLFNILRKRPTILHHINTYSKYFIMFKFNVITVLAYTKSYSLSVCSLVTDVISTVLFVVLFPSCIITYFYYLHWILDSKPGKCYPV